MHFFFCSALHLLTIRSLIPTVSKSQNLSSTSMVSCELAILNSSEARTRSWLFMSSRTTARLMRSSPTTSSYWAGRICWWITLAGKAEGERGRLLHHNNPSEVNIWVCARKRIYLPWVPFLWRRAFPRRCLRGCGCTLWPGHWDAPSTSWQRSPCWRLSPWSGQAPLQQEFYPGPGRLLPHWTSLLNKREPVHQMMCVQTWQLWSMFSK